MGIFSRQNETDDQLRALALNAVMAEHFIHHATHDKLQIMIRKAVEFIGRDPADWMSVHDGTCDLSELPKMQQLFFVSSTCRLLGMAPEIPDCDWLDAEYSESVQDQAIRIALSVIRDLKGVTVNFYKGAADFQSLYRTGMYRPMGFDFEMIVPSPA